MKRDIENISKIVTLLEEAESMLGAPYKYGAYSEKAKGAETEFDCSSFVQYIYKKVGVKLPRSTIFQAKEGKDVKGKKFLPGDLLFFRSDRGHYHDDLFSGKKIYIGHVAIYFANNLIIHAKSSFGGVVLQKLSELQKNKNYEVVLTKRYFDTPNIGGYKISPFSQLLDIKEKKWQKRSCGIVSLAMAMSFLKKNKINLNEVLEKGIEKEAYIKDIGWSHKELVNIAKHYGFLARAYDEASKENTRAFSKLLTQLEKGPVMVSIHKDLNIKNAGHLVLLSGIRKGKVEYYDPNAKERMEVKREAELYAFLKGWKKRFIIIKDKK